MFEMFRSPERPTFAISGKSRQKRQKEPPVPSPPDALYDVRNCKCLPHVHAGFSFSIRQKDCLCSSAAAADRCGEGALASNVRAVGDAGPYGILPYLFVGGGVPDAPPCSDSAPIVAPHERQRRKRKVDASYKAIMIMFRERVV